VRIAIIGAGISGLAVARSLKSTYEITLFDAGKYAGGHVNTVSVEWNNERHDIDTGFIVFNDRTYPQFSQLLDDLGVPSVPTTMSFSVRCDLTGLEYNGSSLNTVFSQRLNLFRPRFLKMLQDILRFNRNGPQDLLRIKEDQTVGEYLREEGYSARFAEKYLFPMGAAIWSCPMKQFEEFPIRFILEFYHNHGLLSLRDRPQWRVVCGGSKQYIDRMIEPFRDRIRLNHAVRRVRRLADSVEVTHERGCEYFDEVVFACHSDQALHMLADPDPLETELLSAFPYFKSTAVLHTDISVLPKIRRAWASWNYHIPSEHGNRPTLTYNMNILQHIRSKDTFCVTLNEEHLIDPRKIIASFEYAHPIFTVNRARVQRRHQELIRHRRTSYCGAYWRNGFHEDGLVSALNVVEAFKNVQVPVPNTASGVLACS
jgi:uncharacterized protein